MAGATGVVTDIIGVVLNAKFPEDQTRKSTMRWKFRLEMASAWLPRCSSNSAAGWSKLWR